MILLYFYVSVASALNQLSFSGGGSFGALEIGILKKVLEINHPKYDLYTGISAGALNAGILSYYSDIHRGVEATETLYKSVKNKMVYKIFPPSGNSLLNTSPFKKTLTDIIATMPNKPLIRSFIGATNLDTGKLDIFNYQHYTDEERVSLLMASCAIPCIFPPVQFKDKLYADGCVLSNELINVEHDDSYLNITFITPYDDYEYEHNEVVTLGDMFFKTAKIIIHNFNNPMASFHYNCKTAIGEINKYYVPSEVLKGYHILDFNKCETLIDIGYRHVIHKKYIIC